MIARDKLAYIGSALKSEREAKNLRIRDVANVLKIRATYLEFVETGRIEELPGGIYANCYVKSYADFLGVDCGKYAALVANTNSKMPEEAVAPTCKTPDKSIYRSLFYSIAPHKFLVLLCGLILLMLLL